MNYGQSISSDPSHLGLDDVTLCATKTLTKWWVWFSSIEPWEFWDDTVVDTPFCVLDVNINMWNLNKNPKKVMFNQNKVVILGFQMLFYFYLYHLESRWLSTPKRLRGLVRGYDKPRLMVLEPSILSRWYIQNDSMTHPFPFSTDASLDRWQDACSGRVPTLKLLLEGSSDRRCWDWIKQPKVQSIKNWPTKDAVLF